MADFIETASLTHAVQRLWDRTSAIFVKKTDTASTTSDGLMTKDDKQKLDNVAVGATKVLIDNTLAEEGKAADAKTVGDAVENLQNDISKKIIAPVDASGQIDSGVAGQILQTKGDGTTEWVTPTGGSITVDDTLTNTGAAADAKKTGDEITDLKADLSGIQIDDGGMTYTQAGDAVRGQISDVKKKINAVGSQEFVNLYGADEETGFVQNDGSIATNGSWANYSTGTIVLDAGTYTIYGYTQNNTVSGSRYGIAIINGGNVETYKNAYLTDNKEVITLAGRRIVKISATSDVKKMVTSGDGIRPYATYDPRFILSNDLTHQFINNVYGVNFELGSINDPGGVPTFVSDNHRVRTAQPIDLVSGDVIGLTDYENAEFCVFWQNELGGYANTVYYLREDYVVRFSGKYWICIRGIPETLITQISQLWGLLKIVKSGNQFGAHIHKTNAILGVNHRGFSANKRFPENTLIAFKASKLFGFDAVETDVAFTSDNVPVLLHDATINRTARNIDGTEISTDIDIGTITYAQALEYDFGLYAQSAYAGTKIPTFEQFISLCKNIDLHPFIELKDNNGVQYDQSLILGLVDIVDSYGMGKNVTWTSFNKDYLRWISEYKPDAELQLNVFTVTARAVEIVTDELMTGENIVIIASQSFTDNEIEMCSDAKVPLGVYTLNTPATMETTPAYATYVTSDTINASEYFYNKDISLT